MFSYIGKLYSTRYLNSNIVLLLDLATSVASSALVILLGSKIFTSTGITTETIFWWLGGALIFSSLFFMALRTQHAIIRHSTLHSLSKITLAVAGKFAALTATFWCLPEVTLTGKLLVLLMLDGMTNFTLLVMMRMAMIHAYYYVRSTFYKEQKVERLLVYGIGNKSVSVITRLIASPNYRIVGFITEGARQRLKVSELSVYNFKTKEDVAAIKERLRIDSILFAAEEDAREERERLVKHCTDLGIRVLIVPSIDEVLDGQLTRSAVREVKIEDLLGRDEIKISINEIQENFSGKTVLVTGAAGSIGSELCRQLASFGVKKLVLYDNAETPMHNLRLEIEERWPQLDFVPIIGDVRQLARIDFAFRKFRPQVVFHAAAYKHVPLMEENPCEAVLVNVTGSRSVADKCIEYGVEKMVMVSTDKAVNPTNIMGCTKRLAEIYVQSLGLAIEQGKHTGKTKFVTTRFGNVLGSNGSVIPRFREQIAKGGPITVTHPDITRFFMTIPEACRLVLEAATMSTGNQIFVFDMGESVKIAQLATRMIELAGLVPGRDIKIEYTGLRPGEKLYEEVLSNSENTMPTQHNRIRIAKVREYDYADAVAVTDRLEELSREVEIPDMVRLMKRTVPEFISKNSKYEEFDKELEEIRKNAACS